MAKNNVFQIGRGTGAIGGIMPVQTSRLNPAAKTVPLLGIVVDTIAVVPGTINAGVVGQVTLTIAGAAVGDNIDFQPPSNLDAGLMYGGCFVSAANTVKLLIGNITASPITATSKNWTYTWEDLT